MLLWDELDDWAAAARHVASSAAGELADIAPALVRTLPMLLAWLLVT